MSYDLTLYVPEKGTIDAAEPFNLMELQERFPNAATNPVKAACASILEHMQNELGLYYEILPFNQITFGFSFGMPDRELGEFERKLT